MHIIYNVVHILGDNIKKVFPSIFNKMSLSSETVATTVYEGQKPGTSGLRKKVIQKKLILCK